MLKYQITGTYTAEGMKGVLKDGGSGRKAAVERVVASVGGTLESFYYGAGSGDFFIVANLPDAAAATSIAVTVVASGSVSFHSTQLITVEEMDAAVKLTPSYRRPGQ